MRQNLGAKNLFYCTPLSNDHVLEQVTNLLLSFPGSLDSKKPRKKPWSEAELENICIDLRVTKYKYD